jgi:hypothetical protein
MFAMIKTEDRRRQTAVEDRFRAREACPCKYGCSTAAPQNRNALRAPFPNSGVLTNGRECDYLIVLITSDTLLISFWRDREEDISAKYH